MTRFLHAFLAAVLSLSVCSAWAAPTFTATTTIVKPDQDTYTIPSGSFNVSVAFESKHKYETTGANANQQFALSFERSLSNRAMGGADDIIQRNTGTDVINCDSMGDWNFEATLSGSRTLVQGQYTAVGYTEFHNTNNTAQNDSDEKTKAFGVSF